MPCSFAATVTTGAGTIIRSADEGRFHSVTCPAGPDPLKIIFSTFPPPRCGNSPDRFRRSSATRFMTERPGDMASWEPWETTGIPPRCSTDRRGSRDRLCIRLPFIEGAASHAGRGLIQTSRGRSRVRSMASESWVDTLGGPPYRRQPIREIAERPGSAISIHRVPKP